MFESLLFTYKFIGENNPPITLLFFVEIIRLTFSMLRNTAPFDSSGHPAISINAGFDDGLPVGMMIVGRKFDETTVFKVARAFEKIRDSE